jgi:Undecaprenyl-phosphate glucose phosphotransferase
MLKKHRKFFEKLIIFIDSVIIAACWIGAYHIRFTIQILPVTKGIPNFILYTKLLFFIIPLWIFIFKSMGLYSPRRSASRIEETLKIVKASIISVIFLIAMVYFFFEYKYSRLVFVHFAVLSSLSLTFVRMIIRYSLRRLRKRGLNLRYVLIVGAGKLGVEVLDAIDAVPEMGYRVIGFLTRNENKVGETIKGVGVLGVYEEIDKVMEENEIDQIIVAIPLSSYKKMELILKNLMDEMVDIKVVPDVYQYITLRGGIEELNGLPIINLRDSPLYGWNMIIKRVMDIFISLFGIIITSPLIFIISSLIKLTSKGPVFYRQERMGLDGRTFEMLKFRSMRMNAEESTGAVWAIRGDKRRTKFGRLLRKTSLDELPQFINVLKGEMSLIGPRPERPVFVKEFKKNVPKYMLRHKMKAGMTGWAQINGWRGNTSIKKRIEHDLYYIENWTIMFDLKILIMTLFKVWVDKEAY